MSNNNPIVFAPSKVGVDRNRINAYLNGERVHPLTMEMDLTQLCSRSCPACPFGASRRPGLTLQLPFLERLFKALQGRIPGLVLSGGEPTLAPHFPETIQVARKSGVQQIAVITNGSRLHDPRVQDALLSGVTSVRVSLYDWQEGASEHFLDTLRQIEVLRNRAEREGSPLEIAAAALTCREWIHRFAEVANMALDAGIHWLYFHPFCVDWDSTHPRQADQTGVLEAIEALANGRFRPGWIQAPYERYCEEPLEFDELHGAHFLIQVGADGVNYAGPECKYRPEYALLDLNDYLVDDFFWHPKRLAKIKAINSSNYTPIGTRHRPPIFSHYLQRLLDSERGTKRLRPTEGSLIFRQTYII
jgi:hypothetical protein